MRLIQYVALVSANGAIAHYLLTMSLILSIMEVFVRALEASVASEESYDPWPSIIGLGSRSPLPSLESL